MAAISDLADVLHQAPTILKFLQQGRTLNVLLATNTGMRVAVQQYVTHITFPDQSHMLTFAPGQWPNLQRMSLRSIQDPSAVVGLPQRNWLFMRLQPTFAKLDLDAIMALRTGMWPWQRLTDLQIVVPHGNSIKLRMLSSCQWPMLESLLLDCDLDDSQASLIFRAEWPFLRSLRLFNNCLTHLEGVDHSTWPQLELISLQGNPVSNTGLRRLVRAQWPELTSLNLSFNSPAERPTVTWHQLIEANWPMLSSLDICRSRIEATRMKNIAEARFCSITTLSLRGNSLDSVAIGHLVKGSWMQLRSLNLRTTLCGSIADCLGLLSTGPWLQLELLWMGENGVDVTALPALAQSKWPSLYHLDLADNHLSSNDFRVMGGEASCDDPRDMCRNIWPKLHLLDF